MPSPANHLSNSFVTTHSLPSLSSGDDACMHAQASTSAFIDRRESRKELGAAERRQFGSSHSDLSPDARELAIAIDRYKADNHRRYITCEEMLMVVKQLGYHRD